MLLNFVVIEINYKGFFFLLLKFFKFWFSGRYNFEDT